MPINKFNGFYYGVGLKLDEKSIKTVSDQIENKLNKTVANVTKEIGLLQEALKSGSNSVDLTPLTKSLNEASGAINMVNDADFRVLREQVGQMQTQFANLSETVSKLGQDLSTVADKFVNVTDGLNAKIDRFMQQPVEMRNSMKRDLANMSDLAEKYSAAFKINPKMDISGFNEYFAEFKKQFGNISDYSDFATQEVANAFLKLGDTLRNSGLPVDDIRADLAQMSLELKNAFESKNPDRATKVFDTVGFKVEQAHLKVSQLKKEIGELEAESKKLNNMLNKDGNVKFSGGTVVSDDALLSLEEKIEKIKQYQNELNELDDPRSEQWIETIKKQISLIQNVEKELASIGKNSPDNKNLNIWREYLDGLGIDVNGGEKFSTYQLQEFSNGLQDAIQQIALDVESGNKKLEKAKNTLTQTLTELVGTQEKINKTTSSKKTKTNTPKKQTEETRILKLEEKIKLVADIKPKEWEKAVKTTIANIPETSRTVKAKIQLDDSKKAQNKIKKELEKELVGDGTAKTGKNAGKNKDVENFNKRVEALKKAITKSKPEMAKAIKEWHDEFNDGFSFDIRIKGLKEQEGYNSIGDDIAGIVDKINIELENKPLEFTSNIDELVETIQRKLDSLEIKDINVGNISASGGISGQPVGVPVYVVSGQGGKTPTQIVHSSPPQTIQLEQSSSTTGTQGSASADKVNSSDAKKLWNSAIKNLLSVLADEKIKIPNNWNKKAPDLLRLVDDLQKNPVKNLKDYRTTISKYNTNDLIRQIDSVKGNGKRKSKLQNALIAIRGDIESYNELFGASVGGYEAMERAEEYLENGKKVVQSIIQLANLAKTLQPLRENKYSSISGKKMSNWISSQKINLSDLNGFLEADNISLEDFFEKTGMSKDNIIVTKKYLESLASQNNTSAEQVLSDFGLSSKNIVKDDVADLNAKFSKYLTTFLEAIYAFKEKQNELDKAISSLQDNKSANLKNFLDGFDSSKNKEEYLVDQLQLLRGISSKKQTTKYKQHIADILKSNGVDMSGLKKSLTDEAELEKKSTLLSTRKEKLQKKKTDGIITEEEKLELNSVEKELKEVTQKLFAAPKEQFEIIRQQLFGNDKKAQKIMDELRAAKNKFGQGYQDFIEILDITRKYSESAMSLNVVGQTADRIVRGVEYKNTKTGKTTYVDGIRPDIGSYGFVIRGNDKSVGYKAGRGFVNPKDYLGRDASFSKIANTLTDALVDAVSIAFTRMYGDVNTNLFEAYKPSKNEPNYRYSAEYYKNNVEALEKDIQSKDEILQNSIANRNKLVEERLASLIEEAKTPKEVSRNYLTPENVSPLNPSVRAAEEAEKQAENKLKEAENKYNAAQQALTESEQRLRDLQAEQQKYAGKNPLNYSQLSANNIESILKGIFVKGESGEPDRVENGEISGALKYYQDKSANSSKIVQDLDKRYKIVGKELDKLIEEKAAIEGQIQTIKNSKTLTEEDKKSKIEEKTLSLNTIDRLTSLTLNDRAEILRNLQSAMTVADNETEHAKRLFDIYNQAIAAIDDIKQKNKGNFDGVTLESIISEELYNVLFNAVKNVQSDISGQISGEASKSDSLRREVAMLGTEVGIRKAEHSQAQTQVTTTRELIAAEHNKKLDATRPQQVVEIDENEFRAEAERRVDALIQQLEAELQSMQGKLQLAKDGIFAGSNLLAAYDTAHKNVQSYSRLVSQLQEQLDDTRESIKNIDASKDSEQKQRVDARIKELEFQLKQQRENLAFAEQQEKDLKKEIDKANKELRKRISEEGEPQQPQENKNQDVSSGSNISVGGSSATSSTEVVSSIGGNGLAIDPSSIMPIISGISTSGIATEDTLRAIYNLLSGNTGTDEEINTRIAQIEQEIKNKENALNKPKKKDEQKNKTNEKPKDNKKNKKDEKKDKQDKPPLQKKKIETQKPKTKEVVEEDPRLKELNKKRTELRNKQIQAERAIKNSELPDDIKTKFKEAIKEIIQSIALIDEELSKLKQDVKNIKTEDVGNKKGEQNKQDDPGEKKKKAAKKQTGPGDGGKAPSKKDGKKSTHKKQKSSKKDADIVSQAKSDVTTEIVQAGAQAAVQTAKDTPVQSSEVKYQDAVQQSLGKTEKELFASSMKYMEEVNAGMKTFREHYFTIKNGVVNSVQTGTYAHVGGLDPNLSADTRGHMHPRNSLYSSTDIDSIDRLKALNPYDKDVLITPDNVYEISGLNKANLNSLFTLFKEIETTASILAKSGLTKDEAQKIEYAAKLGVLQKSSEQADYINFNAYAKNKDGTLTNITKDISGMSPDLLSGLLTLLNLQEKSNAIIKKYKNNAEQYEKDEEYRGIIAAQDSIFSKVRESQEFKNIISKGQGASLSMPFKGVTAVQDYLDNNWDLSELMLKIEDGTESIFDRLMGILKQKESAFAKDSPYFKIKSAYEQNKDNPQFLNDIKPLLKEFFGYGDDGASDYRLKDLYETLSEEKMMQNPNSGYYDNIDTSEGRSLAELKAELAQLKSIKDNTPNGVIFATKAKQDEIISILKSGVKVSGDVNVASGDKGTSGESGTKKEEKNLSVIEQSKQAQTAINQMSNDAKIKIDSTGKQTINTIQKIGAETAKVTTITEDGVTKSTLELSNKYEMAMKSLFQKIRGDGGKYLFGAETVRFGVEATEAQDTLLKYADTYRQLEEAMERYKKSGDVLLTDGPNQGKQLQAVIDELQVKLGQYEQRLISISNASQSFLGNKAPFAMLNGTQLNDSANSLKLLAVSTEQCAVAFNGVYNNGKKLMYDVLQDGSIKRYSLEVDEATGNVRKMEVSETALVNALQNVNKVAKQSEELNGIFILDDVNKDAAIVQNYKKNLQDMHEYVRNVWETARENGGLIPIEEQDKIYAMSQEVLRLGAIIKNEYKNVANAIDSGVPFIKFDKNVDKDMLESEMRLGLNRYANVQTMQVSNTQYDSVTKSMTADLVDLSGEITKVKLKYDELLNGVQVSSVRSTNSVDDITAKMNKLVDTIDAALDAGVINKQMPEYTWFEAEFVKLDDLIDNIKNGTIEYNRDAIKAWNEQRQAIVDAGNALSDIAKKNAQKSLPGVRAVEAQINRQIQINNAMESMPRGLENESYKSYIAEYEKLIKLRNDFMSEGTIGIDINQKKLQAAADKVRVLGDELFKLMKTSADLQASAASEDDILLDFDVNNLESEMKKFAGVAEDATKEQWKFDDSTKSASYTIRDADNTVHEMIITYDAYQNQLVRVEKQHYKVKSGLEQFVDSLGSKFKELARYLLSFGSVYEVFNVIRQGVTYVREIDSALTELKKVTDETDATYDAFLQSMSKTGSVVGATVADLTTMASEWARLGYSIEDSAKLAESTAILLNVSEFEDATKASEALISTMQAFQYTADESQHVVDILNEVKVYLPPCIAIYIEKVA